MNLILREGLSWSAQHHIDADRIHVSLAASGASGGTGFDATLGSLAAVRISYRLDWPVDVVVRSGTLGLYNDVMRLLLAIKRAKMCLADAQGFKHVAERELTAWLRTVRGAMLHFVENLEQYCLTRVIESVWHEFGERMQAAPSLDAACALHERYVATVRDGCLLGPKAELVLESIRKVLNLACLFHAKFRQYHTPALSAAARTSLQSDFVAIEHDFRQCTRFLLSLLARIVARGGYPHLEDLLGRLNFNGFYSFVNSVTM